MSALDTKPPAWTYIATVVIIIALVWWHLYSPCEWHLEVLRRCQ